MSRVWHYTLLLSMALLGILLFQHNSLVQATYQIWLHNGTYNHDFFVPMVTVWLIWRNRSQTHQTPPHVSYLGLLWLLCANLLWLAGQQSASLVVQQYALVGIIIGLIWSLWGTQACRPHLFALLFLFLAVPVGESLVPTLMNLTSEFTVAALQLVGIPVYQEGNFLSLPTGNWSIVEACSGLRYLISSFTLGVLFSHLMYRSRLRQLSFIFASIAVPIVANEIRAFLIILIGHLSSMRLATGVDHIIYGWLFFGLVMLVLFRIGALFREDLLPPTHLTIVSPVTTVPPVMPKPIWIMGWGMALLLITSTVVFSHHLDAVIKGQSAAVRLITPTLLPWQPTMAPPLAWSPHYQGSRAQLQQTYHYEGAEVTLSIHYYHHQIDGHELITQNNGLIMPGDPFWHEVSRQTLRPTFAFGNLPITELRLTSQAQLLLVWRWYWVAGHWLDNPYEVKAWQAVERIFQQQDEAAVMVVSTPITQTPTQARTTLHSFTAQLWIPLTRLLPQATHD